MEGWPVSTLGKLCQIELGRTPSRSNPNFWDTNKVTDNIWLSIADLPQTFNARVFESKEHISDEALAKSKMVLEGTLLVSFKLTLGRLAFAGRNLYTNEAIASLTILDEKEITKEYLYWYLTYFDWDKAAEGEEKIKGKTLNKKKLNVLPVIIPPLPKQKQIVATLDKAFAAIDTATANTKKNLAKVQELLNSKLNDIFSEHGKESEIQNLRDVCKVIAGQSPKGTNYNTSGEGLPFYQGKKEFCDKYLGAPKKWTTQITREAIAGDILMSVRAPVGPINFSTQEICIGRGLAAIRVNKKMDREFLFYLLLSMQSNIKGNEGAVFASINKEQIENIKVLLPPLSEQKKMVSVLDKISAEVRSLSDNYNTKLNALANLKQSLLHQAFTGQLTADAKTRAK